MKKNFNTKEKMSAIQDEFQMQLEQIKKMQEEEEKKQQILMNKNVKIDYIPENLQT